MSIKYFNINTIRVITLVALFLGYGTKANAIVTESGKVSTQWKYDYATGIAEPFECETYEEFIDIRRNYLRQQCSYKVTETGSEVEWRVDNAIFHNIICNGDMLSVISRPDSFYWEVASDKVPSEYCQYEENWIGGEWDAYMIPGSEDIFRLFESKTLDDVSIEILEIETRDIQGVQLAQYYFDQFDGPSGAPLKRSRTDGDITNPKEDSFFPIELVKPLRRIYGGNRFDVSVGLGMFKTQPEWKLKAITRLKYRVTNAEFIGNWSADVKDIAGDRNTVDTAPIYYNLQGIYMMRPKGFVICVQNGKAKKMVL